MTTADRPTPLIAGLSFLATLVLLSLLVWPATTPGWVIAACILISTLDIAYTLYRAFGLPRAMPWRVIAVLDLILYLIIVGVRLH